MRRQWKIAFAIICCVALLATLLVACDLTVKVTFDPNYEGATSITKNVAFGSTVTPPTVTRDGYTFGGWYKDKACTQPTTDSDFTIIAGITFYAKWTKIQSGDGTVADMYIHFIDFGNSSSGDSVYIKAGDTDILIDAGSTKESAPIIKSYVDRYCTDGILEYVIVTHSDTDHIYAFTRSGGGIFEMYDCKTIIDFAQVKSESATLKTYYERRDAEVAAGANNYTALECYNNANGAQRVYDIADGITMEILYQKYYEQVSSDNNNHSVCVLFTQGDNHYLFTGDLEESGEKSLVECNPNLPEVQLFKAGHHGSATSTNEVLLKVIRPEYVVASCVAGDRRYGFPSQDFINRVAPYTDKVYVTMAHPDDASTTGKMNGNIIFSCVNGVIEVHGSNNDIILKDTAWFAANRTMPEAWQ